MSTPARPARARRRGVPASSAAFGPPSSAVRSLPSTADEVEGSAFADESFLQLSDGD